MLVHAGLTNVDNRFHVVKHDRLPERTIADRAEFKAFLDIRLISPASFQE